MSRNLVEETIYDVFATGVWEATNSIADSSFFFVESLVREVNHSVVVDEKLDQRFKQWSLLNTIMQALIETIINKPAFIVPVATFERQLMINAVEGKLSREPPVAKEIQLTVNRSRSVPAGTTLDEEFKASCLRCRQHIRIGQRTRHLLVKSRDKCKKRRRSSLPFPQADGSLKTAPSKSSG